MSRKRPSRDVAVYAPSANAFFDRKRVLPGEGGGGAEFQTSQLSAGLAREGLSVAHIVFPVEEPIELEPGRVLIERPLYLGRGGPRAKLREAKAIWDAISEADAEVTILRGYGLALIVGALFGFVRRRRILMSGSNDLDFLPTDRSRSRVSGVAYHRAIAAADLIVVQTDQQRRVAAHEFPKSSIQLVRSFAEPAEPRSAEPEGYLWAGRIVGYKHPLDYLELASRVPDATFWMICVPTPETPADLGEEIKMRAASLANVDLLEPRPRKELLGLVERSIAVVLTSAAEGMPNVFLEAWMRSVPVVSLRFDPDGSIAREGMGISARGDLDAFVAGTEQLRSDPEAAEEMGARGRAYVLREHAPDAVARGWAAAVNSARCA